MPIFSERTRFRQYDVLFATAALAAATSYFTVVSLVGSVPHYGRAAVAGVIAVALLTRLGYLLRVRQETRVTRKNVKVRTEARRAVKERIRLDEIESCDVVRHPVYAQRYGTGGWLGGERTLSLVGRNGLAIRTHDGEQYFVGSRRPKELAKAIRKAVAA